VLSIIQRDNCSFVVYWSVFSVFYYSLHTAYNVLAFSATRNFTLFIPKNFLVFIYAYVYTLYVFLVRCVRGLLSLRDDSDQKNAEVISFHVMSRIHNTTLDVIGIGVQNE